MTDLLQMYQSFLPWTNAVQNEDKLIM
jgi:hypothetical protein